MEIIVLTLGVIASCFVVSLSLVRKQRTIALLTVLMSAVLIGQYALLSQPVAAVLSAMSLAYGLLIFGTVGLEDRFSRIANGTAVRVLLLVGYTVVFVLLNGGLGWNTQLLAYGGSMLMVLVMMVKQAWTVKLVLLAAGICWTVFQFQTGAYGNLIGQIFYFGGLGWSSWKLWSDRTRDSSTAALQPA